MLRRIRVAGWGLLIVGTLLVTAFVTFGALRAKSESEVGQWGLWVGVAALVVGAIGVVVPIADKITNSTRRAEASSKDPEKELAKVVLAQSRVARSWLLGAGEAGDQAANVRFVKRTGRFRDVGGGSEGDLDTVLSYYQSLSPRRMVILGEPGAGKTVLAMELLIGLLERRQKDKSSPVPVLVSAAAYDTSRPWEEWLAEHLEQRFRIGLEAAAALVRDRRVLPVIDGLDEMDVSGKPERARALVAALNSANFMQSRKRAAVVVTCRRKEYRALGRGVARATHIEMVPMNGKESADYLADQLSGKDEEQAWQRVLACLRVDPGGLLATQLETPWRLTLALTAFRDGCDPAVLLPRFSPNVSDENARQYTQRVDKLLLDRYVPSSVRLYDPSGRYTPDQVHHWLMALVKHLDWQARHNGSPTDIQLENWWRSVGRWATAAHIVLVELIAVPWIVAAIIRRNAALAIVGALIMSLAILAGFPPPPRRIKARQLTTRRGLKRFGSRFAAVFVGSLVIGLVLVIASGDVRWFVVASVGGFVPGLVFGFVSGLEVVSAQAVGPRDVIRADGRYGLVYGLIWGFAAGSGCGLLAMRAFGLVSGVAFGLVCWLAFGLAFGLAGGAGTWTRFHIAVVIAAIRKLGPLRFGAWLDWAHEAGLLRLSGIAYQFRNQQLQDWLKSGG